MSAQTSYDLVQGGQYPGMLHSIEAGDRVSRSAEGAADIPFGAVVSRGTNPDKQAVAGGAGAFFAITIRSLDREGDSQTGAIAYRPLDTMALMRKGYIWVTVPSGAVPGDVANYVDASGVIDSGAPGAGQSAIPNATFETTAPAGGIALLRVAS